MLVRVLVLCVLMTQVACAANVPAEENSFARTEVTRLIRVMDKDRLVAFTRAGTLILGSPSTEITDGLAALGESAVAPLADAFVTARTDGVRYGIGLALAGRGEPGERALVRLLKNPSLKGRRWLLQGLAGKVSGPIVIALRTLVADPDHELAERAILDLAETEDDEGLTILRELLRGTDRALAKKAALALAFQKDSSGVELLLEDYREAKSGALALFQTMKGLGLSGAREAAGPMVQSFVTYAAKIDPDEPPGRVTGLSDFEARFRKMPASERAMLIAASCAGSIGGLSYRAPRPTVVALLSHANLHVRRMALDVISAVGDASAAPAVLTFLEAGLPAKRAGSSDAGHRGDLGRTAPPDVEDDADSEAAMTQALAVAAAQALRNLAAPAARDRLFAAYKRAPRPLADWIALALAAINDPDGVRRTVQLARGEGDMAVAAISTLGGSTSREAIDHLSGLMELGDPQMALLAASSLSRPGFVHARKPLEAMLASARKDNDPQRIGVASLGLGLVGDASVIGSLGELTHHADRSVRRAAVVGLYYLTGETRRYKNAWGEDVTFVPTTFHVKMRQETTARPDSK